MVLIRLQTAASCVFLPQVQFWLCLYLQVLQADMMNSRILPPALAASVWFCYCSCVQLQVVVSNRRHEETKHDINEDG